MRKILVVDDTPPNRMILGRYVTAMGHVPIMASDGARALAVLEDNPDIACVITDCQMPALDGPGLTRAIRDQYGGSLPVLIYSAYLGVKEVREILEMGATRFLNHPVGMASLAETLGEVLN